MSVSGICPSPLGEVQYDSFNVNFFAVSIFLPPLPLNSFHSLKSGSGFFRNRLVGMHAPACEHTPTQRLKKGENPVTF